MVPGFARQLDDRKYHKANRTIIKLDMGRNKIGDAGATALASALQVTLVMDLLCTRHVHVALMRTFHLACGTVLHLFSERIYDVWL